MKLTFEKYRERCLKGGSTEEEIKNTWELAESIKKILNDEDMNPFTAPELVPPTEARLARLFIDRYTMMTKENDKAIAEWLRARLKFAGPETTLAERVESGEHWKWWHAERNRREAP